MKISNIHITGGDQQFADVIINHRLWKELSDQERRFVQFLVQDFKDQQQVEMLADAIHDTYNNDKRTIENKNKLTSILLENKDRIIQFSKQVGIGTLASILANFGLKLLDIGIE